MIAAIPGQVGLTRTRAIRPVLTATGLGVRTGDRPLKGAWSSLSVPTHPDVPSRRRGGGLRDAACSAALSIRRFDWERAFQAENGTILPLVFGPNARFSEHGKGTWVGVFSFRSDCWAVGLGR